MTVITRSKPKCFIEISNAFAIKPQLLQDLGQKQIKHAHNACYACQPCEQDPKTRVDLVNNHPCHAVPKPSMCTCKMHSNAHSTILPIGACSFELASFRQERQPNFTITKAGYSPGAHKHLPHRQAALQKLCSYQSGLYSPVPRLSACTITC